MLLRQRLLFNIELEVKEAIEFLRKYEPPEGYFLAFSGGKDSVVIYDLAKKAQVKFRAFYSATQIDPPEVVRFIHRCYPDVKWLFPEKPIFKLIPEKGFPTMVRRWCCDLLKKKPAEKIPLKHRIVGVRAEESLKRKLRKDNPEKYGGLWIYKPIFSWSEWQVWEYIEQNKLPYCKLYDQGFSRLGCIVCPFLDGKEHLKQRRKYPEHYKAFEKAMRKLWECRDKYVYPELTFSEYLNRWYSKRSVKHA